MSAKTAMAVVLTSVLLISGGAGAAEQAREPTLRVFWLEADLENEVIVGGGGPEDAGSQLFQRFSLTNLGEGTQFVDLSVFCTLGESRSFTFCSETFIENPKFETFWREQLVTQGIIHELDHPHVLPVTGGTGSWHGARGEVVLKFDSHEHISIRLRLLCPPCPG